MVDIRALDPATLSVEDVAGIYRVIAECHEEANPREPCRMPTEVEGYLRHVPASDPRAYWIVGQGQEVVAFAQLSSIHDSPSGYVELLVRPKARRRGRGTALLAVVRELATALERRLLIGSHATEPGARFAAWVGAEDTRREIRSLLRLPVRADSGLRPVSGYSLHSWVGAAPEELLDSYARAREAINDAPLAAEDDRAVWPPSRVRELERAVERRGRDIRVTVALDENGSVVAFTELRVSRAPGAMAGTEDTAVLSVHRRRGLARWLKTESLQELQRNRPDVKFVTTTNDETNEAMLALNGELGFEPVAVYTTAVFDLY
jgi:mycothiol synthase